MLPNKDHRPQVQINVLIRGEHRESGDLQTICRALQQVPEINVTCSSDIPSQCIAVDGKVLAVVDDLDAWDSLSLRRASEFLEWVQSLRPAIIFKTQYRRGVDYPQGTVSAGYICHPLSHDLTIPTDLASRFRPIDVTARMRTLDYGSPETDWMRQRAEIVNQAKHLADAGLNATHDKIPLPRYVAELPNSKIGFNWRGFGMLSFRLIEYLRAGVIPVTQPLGLEWPLRQDIVLEDEIHCIFCDDPKQFGREARLLLRDQPKMIRIRENILDLWKERLCLASMGRWYWNKLSQVKAC